MVKPQKGMKETLRSYEEGKDKNLGTPQQQNFVKNQIYSACN